MSIYLSNLKKYLQKITPFSPIVLLTTLLVVSVLFYSSPVSGGPYLDSAHGNTTYGVLWTTGAIYTQGNCGNCHIQHASIGGEALAPYNFALFYDDYIAKCDLFCYRCHSDLAGIKQAVTNYPYCVAFGGGTAFYPNIRMQFCSPYSLYDNCGSKHNLYQIREVIKNDAYSWGFNSDADPCVACHPPHDAQRNHPVAIDGEGKLNTAIRRPSHYKSTNSADLLWGDDANERMSSYASSAGGTYQSPYYADTISGRYEPSGNASPSDGSDLPDYVTFCMDCHQYAQSDPERSGATVKAIDWSAERHGAVQANNDGCSGDGGEGSTKAPYTNPDANYVLSCTDCHEPHGTDRRLHLIRRFINGQDIGADTETCGQVADYVAICETCHNVPHPDRGSCVAATCHGHGGTCAGGGSCLNKPCF